MCIHIKQGKIYLAWVHDRVDIVYQTSSVTYKMLSRITFQTVLAYAIREILTVFLTIRIFFH